MSHNLKPGEIADRDGEFELYDESGRPTGMSVSMKKGQSLPPTDKEGQYYSWRD